MLRIDMAAQHVRVAKPLLDKIVVTMGILTALAIVGGITAIVWNAFSPTKFDMVGVELSTGHVGVAFTAIGLICMMFVVRSVLKTTRQLAALPKDEP